jgi:hypothetical protein
MRRIDGKHSLVNAVALGALAFALGLGCTRGPSPETDVSSTPQVPEKLLVLPFENNSGAGGTDLGFQVSDMLTAQLRLSSLSTLGPADIAAIYQESGYDQPKRLDGAALREYAHVTGCQGIVTGEITAYNSGKRMGKDRLAFNVRVLNPRSGATMHSTAFVSDASNIDATIRGIDQLTLFGVQQVTQSIARAR